MTPNTPEYQFVQKRIDEYKIIKDLKSCKKALKNTFDKEIRSDKRSKLNFKYTNLEKLISKITLKGFTD